jgi:hypothetical protein
MTPLIELTRYTARFLDETKPMFLTDVKIAGWDVTNDEVHREGVFTVQPWLAERIFRWEQQVATYHRFHWFRPLRPAAESVLRWRDVSGLRRAVTYPIAKTCRDIVAVTTVPRSSSASISDINLYRQARSSSL